MDITGARLLYLVVISRWSGWGDWIEPELVGDNRTTRLTELPWKVATSGYGSPRVNANVAGHPLQVAGKPVKFGIGVHSPSVVVFELPAGHTRLKARGGLDDEGHGSATFLVFVGDPVFAKRDSAAGSPGQAATGELRPGEPAEAAGSDTTGQPAASAAELQGSGPYVEMIGGDRLPGVVTGFTPDTLDALDPAPAHLSSRRSFTFSPSRATNGSEPLSPSGSSHWIGGPAALWVKPSVGIAPPEGPPPSHVRVRAGSVRRIVWEDRPDLPGGHTPGNLYTRGGESLAFRSAQFSDDQVRLLTDGGIRHLPFAEIARLDLPQADPWETYFDDLSRLCPEGDGELIRLQTAGGLAATTSEDRTLTIPLGDSPQTIRWFVAVQPAWALDLLWFDPQAITSWSRSRAEHVPLSRFAPVRVTRRGSLAGGSWRWQVDRNVQGGPLASAGRTFDWGFGVHGDCELYFTLPAAGESFRSQVGLDRVVGRGGCVRARIFLGSTESRPLYESPLIVGSNRVLDTGQLPLPSDPAGERTLILQVDSAHKDRPPDADPLDIRDVCNWLEPRIQLRGETLRREMPRRARESLSAWQGWKIRDNENPLRFVNLLEQTGHGLGPFATAVVPRAGRLTLEREIEVGPDANWFIARAAGRSVDPEQPTRVIVDIAGQTVAEWTVGLPADGLPQGPEAAVPLLAYQGKRVLVTVTQTGGRPADAVAWSSLGVSSAPPPLIAVLEDKADCVPADNPPQGDPRLVGDDRYSGDLSLRMDAGGHCLVKLPAEIRIRENPGVGEHRYLRFAFRKFGGGRVGLGLDHANVREKLARYDAGPGPPTGGFARRIWELNLPSEWIVQTVDVFGDFGQLDIQALELAVPDGQYARFDQIYFARTRDDFQWLPSAPDPEATNAAARRILAAVPRTKGLPATLVFDRGNGLTGSGIIVDANQGYVLTAGHVIAGSKTTFDVYLPDGRKLVGRRLGINRNCDVGMLQIDTDQPLPAVEIDFDTHEAYPGDAVYLAIAHPQRPAPQPDEPAAHLVTVREISDRSIRTSFQLPDCCRGGPLLDQQGRLIGIYTRQTGDNGEFLYTPTSELAPGWTKLIEGDIWGRWLAGVGPKFGVIVTTQAEGCQITQVFADSPAAGAKLQVGDWIRKSMANRWPAWKTSESCSPSRDPDESITLDVRRGDRSFKVELRLMQHRRQVPEKQPDK